MRSWGFLRRAKGSGASSDASTRSVVQQLFQEDLKLGQLSIDNLSLGLILAARK